MKITSRSFYLLFIFMLNCLYLQGDPRRLNFDDLSSEDILANASFDDLQGQLVQLRGFWYPLSPDAGILAAQPNLKSCCLKIPSKIPQQILVRGSLAHLPAQRALTLEGIFRMDPIYNPEGQLTQLFILEEAKEVPQLNSPLSLRILCFLLTCISAVWLFLKWKKSRK